MPIVTGHAYAEQFTAATTQATAATGAVLLSATLDPPTATDYFIMWSGLAAPAGVGGDRPIIMSLRNNSGATVAGIHVVAKDTTDSLGVMGFAKETLTSTASQIYQISVQTFNTNSDAKTDNLSIIAIRAATSDQFATGANALVTTTGFATLATLSFTPSATGTYAVFAYAEINASATFTANLRNKAALVLNGASHFMATTEMVSGSTEYHDAFVVYGGMAPFELTTSEQVLSIVAANGTSTNAGSSGNTNVRNPSIMVWRMDSLPTYAYGQATGRTTVACSTATTNKLTVSLTSAATDYLVIGSVIYDNSGLTTSSIVILDEDGTNVTQTLVETMADETNYFFAPFYKKTLTAATHNFSVQFLSESTNTTGLQEAAVLVIKLGGVVTYLVTAAATAIGIPLIVRQGRLIQSAVASGVANVVRQGRLLLGAIATGIADATLVLGGLIQLTFAAVATGVAAVIRQGQLTLSATSPVSATVVRAASLTQSAIAVGVSNVVRQGQLIMIASGAAVAGIVRQAQLVKAATATGVALVVRQAQLIFAAASSGVALVVRSLTMTVQAAVAVGSALVVRQGQLILAASATGIALVSLLKALIFNAVTVGVVTVTRTTSMTLAAVSNVTALLVRSVSMTFAAIVTGFADLWAHPVLRKFTGTAGLGIFLKTKTRWAKRKRNWKPRP